MKNLKIETRQSKAGNNYQFISGEGTYYLSALKKARTKGQSEAMNTTADETEFVKHLLYNRVLGGFVCKSDSWNIVESALNALTLPANWKDLVKNIMPKANLFRDEKPAKSSAKVSKKDNSIIDTLVAKLEKYSSWDEIPPESIPKLNKACEENSIKIAQVRKAFESTREPVESVNDLEL